MSDATLPKNDGLERTTDTPRVKQQLVLTTASPLNVWRRSLPLLLTCFLIIGIFPFFQSETPPSTALCAKASGFHQVPAFFGPATRLRRYKDWSSSNGEARSSTNFKFLGFLNPPFTVLAQSPWAVACFSPHPFLCPSSSFSHPFSANFYCIIAVLQGNYAPFLCKKQLFGFFTNQSFEPFLLQRQVLPPDPSMTTPSPTIPAPAARQTVPPPPPLPPNYLGSSPLGVNVASLLHCAITADRARHEHARTLEKWQKTAQMEDINRRARLRRQFEKREEKKFKMPSAGDGLAFTRASLPVMKRQLKLLLEMHNKSAFSGTTAFIASLREMRESWVPDVKAIFRGACPGTWKPSFGTWDTSAGMVTDAQRADLVAMAKKMFAADEPDIRHDALTCLEILEGPGTVAQRLLAVQASSWHFEVEDVFLALENAEGAKVWHPILHIFFSDEVTPEVLRRVKEGLRDKAQVGEFLLPELELGSTIATEAQAWDQAFLRAVDRGIHSAEARAAARMVVDETAPMSEQELRVLRGALHNTEFQALSNNTAWCRAVFGREQGPATLDLPEDLEEYELVGVVATVVNSPVVQEVGLSTMILDTIRGTGKRMDQHPERVSVQDLKLQRGAQTAKQGEGGIIPEGRDVVFRATWCKGLRALLNNRRQVEVEGVVMTFCLKLLPQSQRPVISFPSDAIQNGFRCGFLMAAFLLVGLGSRVSTSASCLCESCICYANTLQISF